MWKLYVASLDDIKSHFFKWRNFPLLSLLSHVVSPAATAAPLPLALYLRRGRRWQYYYHRCRHRLYRGHGAFRTTFAGKLFPRDISAWRNTPTPPLGWFFHMQQKSGKEPQPRTRKARASEACQCTIIAKLNFFHPEKSRTILALHIYYLHISSRYSLETTHEMTLSSVKITFTVHTFIFNCLHRKMWKHPKSRTEV